MYVLFKYSVVLEVAAFQKPNRKGNLLKAPTDVSFQLFLDPNVSKEIGDGLYLIPYHSFK